MLVGHHPSRAHLRLSLKSRIEHGRQSSERRAFPCNAEFGLELQRYFRIHPFSQADHHHHCHCHYSFFFFLQLYASAGQLDFAKRCADCIESLCPKSAHFFYATGLYYQAKASEADISVAMDNFKQAIIVDSEHLPSILSMAQLHLAAAKKVGLSSSLVVCSRAH